MMGPCGALTRRYDAERIDHVGLHGMQEPQLHVDAEQEGAGLRTTGVAEVLPEVRQACVAQGDEVESELASAVSRWTRQ